MKPGIDPRKYFSVGEVLRELEFFNSYTGIALKNGWLRPVRFGSQNYFLKAEVARLKQRFENDPIRFPANPDGPTAVDEFLG